MPNLTTQPVRALVISGGGSKGAFAGGIAQYLIEEKHRHYQIFAGTSAGSLLIPLLALGELERIKKVFTAIEQHHIFSICPFRVRRLSDGQLYAKINHFNTIRMFLKGRKTFGESEKLRTLIQETFTESDYHRLRASGKDVIVTVTNFSRYATEYYSVHECGYDDFCDWMWISANIVPFMSLVVKNGMEYGDGGFGNYLPLREAVRRGACEVDAVILKPAGHEQQIKRPVANAFSLLLRALDFMLEQISVDDLQLGQLESQQKKVWLECYHTPRSLTDNSFIFDPRQMTAWWEEGFRYAKTQGPVCKDWT